MVIGPLGAAGLAPCPSGALGRSLAVSRRHPSVAVPEPARGPDPLPACRRALDVMAGQFPVSPQIRPISARSTVVAQRLTQDHARSFCTMKTGTARVFLRLGLTQLGSPPDAGFEVLPGKTESNEKKNECVFIGS